jgi:hypothetical protein
MIKTTHTIRILTVLFLCLFTRTACSQEIVVNEYFNAASQSDEWTELIVVKDNLDLRGWFLGDNNAGTSSWQPKLEFENHPLWNNLRAGTVIIIDHGANNSECDDVTDTDKSDGFIRVCCRNTIYFSGGSTTTLFLADGGDFVQIVDPSGKMVHGIGHDDDPGSSVVGGNCFTTSTNWTNTNAARTATRPCGNYTYYNFSMEAPTSLKMIAGINADFFAGMQTSASNAFIDTTDTPFEGIGNGGANDQWLIDLRAPDMESQNVCPTKAPDGTISFSWQAATDVFPSDNTTGYIVVRNTTGDFGLPQQGKEYALNSTYGNGPQQVKVVKVIIGSGTTTFSENPGTGTFYYRVFPFRYKNTVAFEHPTRGRTYNTTNFVKVNSQTAPEVTIINDTLCGPGEAKMVIQFPAGTNFDWYLTPTSTSSILSNSDTLTFPVTQNRSFWVGITGGNTCFDNRFEVKAVIKPLVCEHFGADSVCEGTPAYFYGSNMAGVSYQWNLLSPPSGVTSSRSDSNIFTIDVPYFPTKQWIYFRVRALNNEGCLSAYVKDSVYTVPFDPEIISTPSEPGAGDSIRYSILSNISSWIVNTWTVTNGNILSENPTLLIASSTSDSIRVSAVIQTLLPTDGLFCKVNRSQILPIKPEENPLLPINNLISANGDALNSTLNFDRREVKNLAIFDRWGKKIYSADLYKNDWNPDSKEKGTFFYSAEMKVPGAETFEKVSGWIEVVK